MIRITLTLTGALAALAFSSAAAHADPDGPTPIGTEVSIISDVGHPWVAGNLGYQEFSVLNAPSETFEGIVRNDYDIFAGNNDHILVDQDLAGNVPLGEQYNDYTPFFGPATGEYGLVYNDIGGTAEAFFFTPSGDINFPTWFVEAVGPSFFEPSIYFDALPAATASAAELPGLGADLSSLLAGL